MGFHFALCISGCIMDGWSALYSIMHQKDTISTRSAGRSSMSPTSMLMIDR